jgi:plastocyanin
MRMSRLNWRRTGWIVALGFQVLLPGVSAAPVAAPAIVEIKIDNFSFQPAVVTAKAGTQITWTNRDDIPHTVVSESKAFKSKVLATGEKFTYTAGKAGAYTYSCSIHPSMTGKVVVE